MAIVSHTFTFSSHGAGTTFEIPSDVDVVMVEVHGAGGGGGGHGGYGSDGYGPTVKSAGGSGGRVKATFNVADLGTRKLWLYMGQRGYNSLHDTYPGRGGDPDGGDGGGGYTGGGGGGGSSRVATTGDGATSSVFIWAGGGGGGAGGGTESDVFDGSPYDGVYAGGGGGGGRYPGGGGGAAQSTVKNVTGSPAIAHGSSVGGAGGAGGNTGLSNRYGGVGGGGSGGSTASVGGHGTIGDGYRYKYYPSPSSETDYDAPGGGGGDTNNSTAGSGGEGVSESGTNFAGGGGGGSSFVSALGTVNYFDQNGSDGRVIISWEDNTPPEAPTRQVRDNFDAAVAADFKFTFRDTDDPGDTQSAYQLIIENSSTGATAYDSGKVLSSSGTHTLAAGTLTNGTTYRWKVRCWDSEDVVGPFCDYLTFKCSAAPTASITDPTENQVIETSSYDMVWSFSQANGATQAHYQVVLKQGSTTVFDTGKVASSATTKELSPLNNGLSYSVTLQVWSSDGVASVVYTRNFSVSYTAPETPTIVLTGSDADGYIEVSITNPAPSASGVPEVTHNDIYRKGPNDTEFIRIAKNVGKNGLYRDYGASSGAAHQYYARAVGTTGAAANSTTSSATITLSGVWLGVLGSNAPKNFPYGQGRQLTFDPHVQMNDFAGREYPASETTLAFTESAEARMELLPEHITELTALMEARKPLIYRDNRGNKVIGYPRVFSWEETPWGAETNFSVTGTNDSEEV